ncbi:uncharacterized protein LOC134711142 [Mytilus trossulus]|uniref:uncharacterized protein LOC134711142 n=1 Tax=Mytilus trossulus TaxID=6551 RepID=UPI00300498FF
MDYNYMKSRSNVYRIHHPRYITSSNKYQLRTSGKFRRNVQWNNSSLEKVFDRTYKDHRAHNMNTPEVNDKENISFITASEQLRPDYSDKPYTAFSFENDRPNGQVLLRDESTDNPGRFVSKVEFNPDFKLTQKKINHASGLDNYRTTIHSDDQGERLNYNPIGAHPTQLIQYEADDKLQYPFQYSPKDNDNTYDVDRIPTSHVNETHSCQNSPSRGSIPTNVNHIQENKRCYRSTENDETDFEMPKWAKDLLSRKSSFTQRFQQVKESIQKWSLRIRSNRPSRTYSPRHQTPSTNILDGTQINIPRSNLAVKEDQGTHQRNKTNNVVMCILGLFLIVVAVFPVISVIYIYSDKSDYVMIQIKMSFNGSVSQSFDTDSLNLSICQEINSAFTAEDSFFGCNDTRFIFYLLETDLLLVFKTGNFPGDTIVVKTVNIHLMARFVDSSLYYIPDSFTIIKYEFIKKRLLGSLRFIRTAK